MRRIVAVFAAVFLLASMSAIYSQSLADLAKKEKERRQNVKSDAKVITNDDTSKYRAGAVTTGTVPPPASTQRAGSEKEVEAGAQPAATQSDEPVDLQGRTESYWRQTLADARKKTKDLENEANVLTLRLADLQTQFYRESSGFKQQEIQREIQKTFYEQDLNKQNLAKARDQLQDLEKEARKSGALPGWLIPKNP